MLFYVSIHKDIYEKIISISQGDNLILKISDLAWYG